jgi:acyl-coenzyme A synthetase/AMP-(fatty) acid ligase
MCLELGEKLRHHGAEYISAIATPDEVRLADPLAKTKSGQIRRHLLKEVASNG